MKKHSSHNQKDIMKKEIAFQFDLNCRWAVYVPSTKNVNEAIDNTNEVKRVIGELSDLFGGATATPSIGGWRCENGEVVVENTTIVYSFCTTDQAIKHAGDVLAIAQRLCREYNQEAVTVEYNGQVKFVTV